MRHTLAAFLLLSSVLVSWAETVPPPPYQIEFDPIKNVTMSDRDDKDNRGLFITVKFAVNVVGNLGAGANPGEYKIVIEEDGKFVREEALPVPKPADDLSVMLSVDTSGSMKENRRMEQARAAAEIFLGKLPAKAECGLIVFDHEVRPPTIRPRLERKELVDAIKTIQPRGGTAYLDAAAHGLDILKSYPRDKALVLMTDGIDLNSSATVKQIVDQAKRDKIRIYTIGIGEPGKLEPVTSVLALDRSGSMKPPADDNDKTPKIKALHRAASRFVDIMPASGRTTLIPFSDGVETPASFGNNKFRLKQNIELLTPRGETAFFDAVYAAICTLEAENPRGKRVVVAMTDGIDNMSRRRVDEVIERAKDAKTPLYLLGFGRPGELDEKTMDRMAGETGGKFYHARNEKDLLEIFENLSIKIHDDGIDEITLGKLAADTGGEYFHARNVSDLKFILERVTQNIQKKTYSITFPSLRQVADGTQRNITLKLVRAGEVVTTQEGRVQTHGVVIAEMSHLVYLGFLGGLGFLLFLPAMLRRRAEPHV